jgi:chromosomal replication initiator protein
MTGATEAAIERLHQRVARLEGAAERPMLPQIRRIVDGVALHFGFTRIALLGEGREAPVALARHMAMHLVRELHGFSFPRIGRAFGRDHTSVLHAHRRIERLRETDAQLRTQWEALAEALAATRFHPPSQTPEKEA